jgi:GR25 family glycosyltransferase involved in LPS biosynthesis
MELLKNCLFINLEHRKDRLENIEKQLKLIDISGQRFNAIKMKDGAIGCTMSHIKCIEIAKKNNWDYVFICEDDINFTKPKIFLNSLNQFYNDSKLFNSDWKVLIVGGNNCPPYNRLSDYCIQVSSCQTTTGYIVKKCYYDTLLSNFRESASNLLKDPTNKRMYALDMYWKQLQKTDIWYMIIPVTVTQLDNDYSDIEERTVSYSYLMKDLDKPWLFRQY